MSMFRLEAERAGAGPHLFPRPFATIDEADTFAQRNIDALAAHFGWRVRSFRIVELPSYRVVWTVAWHDPVYDPDPFVPSGGTSSGSAGVTPPTPQAPAES